MAGQLGLEPRLSLVRVYDLTGRGITIMLLTSKN